MDAKTARAQDRDGPPQSSDRAAGPDRARRAGGVPLLAVRQGDGLADTHARGCPVSRLLSGRPADALEGDLLHRPRRAIALVDDVLRLAVKLVNETAGLPMPFARLGPAEQVPVQVHFVDLAVAVTAEQILVGSRRGADAPRRSHSGDNANRVQIGVENLNSAVAAIGDIDVAF